MSGMCSRLVVYVSLGAENSDKAALYAELGKSRLTVHMESNTIINKQ